MKISAREMHVLTWGFQTRMDIHMWKQFSIVWTNQTGALERVWEGRTICIQLDAVRNLLVSTKFYALATYEKTNLRKTVVNTTSHHKNTHIHLAQLGNRLNRHLSWKSGLLLDSHIVEMLIWYILKKKHIHFTFSGYFNFGGTMKPRRDMPPPRLSLPGFSANHTSWHIMDPRLTLGSSLPAQPYFIPPSTRRGRITFHLPMNSGLLKWHDHWWKHHACMAPIVSEALRTTSDGGCCFSSCLLYKLIWPETFASLGAGKKKKNLMWCRLTHHDVPPLCWLRALLVESGALPRSLQLPKYHLACFSDRGGRTAWDVKHRKHNRLRGSHPNNATSDVWENSED